MKNQNSLSQSKTPVLFILFCLMYFVFSASVNGQVLFTQSVDADFHRGHYNDMLVASNNVLLPFQASSTGSWLTTTVLPQTLTRHKSATWNNRYVYVTGGYNGVSHSDAVYRATLQAAGISTWTSLGSLPVALSDHALVIGHNAIYVIGGRDETNIYNTIYYATINTNGTIGSWQTSSVSLPTGLWGHTAVYCNGFIYVVGGSDQLDDDTANDDVYFAKILVDNTLSEFVATTSLPSSLNAHTMETNGEEIFVLGGFEDGGTKVNTVYKSNSNADGSLNAWTTQTPLPHAVSYHSSSVINGIIAVLAGETGTGLTKDIYYADINEVSLSWVAGSEMTDFSKGGVAYASNGQIIYSGGVNLSETPVHNSRYVPLTLSANIKVDGLFISTPFTQLGDERYIDELIFARTIGAGSNLELSYRLAGNDKIWGDWTVLSSTSPITVDNTARYLQYKVLFTSDGVDNASLHSVTLSTPGTQLSGNLNAIPEFTEAASPYWITGDISFTAGTHTFEAGTRFLFMPGVRMEVGAANIICNGVSGDSVYFTGYTDEQGLWGGIYFNGSSSSGVSSQFNHVVISNAGSGTYAANLYCLNTSQPSLNNCDIRGSTANGIRLNNAHIMIENTRIHNNELNGLSLTNSSPTVNSSIIDYNGLAGVWHNSTTSNPNYFSSQIANNLYGIHYDSPNFTFNEPNGSPVLSNNTYNGIVLNGGSVSSNSVWNKINYDYIILADIEIRGNPIRLTIEPGNTIKTVEDAKIQVARSSYGGELYAIGTETEPIVFTSWNGNPGGWNGIFFHTNSDAYNSSPSVLDYCLIENGNEYNIYADGTDVRILNSTIQNSAQDAIWFNNSTGLIENCIIQTSNQYGLWLSGTSPGSSPEIRNCQFLNNNSYPLYIETTICNHSPENNTYIGNNPNYIAYGGGTINWDRTFYNEGIPYHILSSITFGQNNFPVLTIEAGNTLAFNPECYLQIGYTSYGSRYGTLIAEGTELLPITFKAYNDTPGGWEGIYLDPRSSQDGAFVSFKHCIIEQGNDYNIYSYITTETTLEDCIIRNSANDGLRLNNSNLSYSNCSFEDNGAYPVSLLDVNSVINPTGNTYTGNALQYIALTAGTYNSNYTIKYDGIPYHILNSITFGQNNFPVLTIEAGNTLAFNPECYLQIGYSSYGYRYGTLIAEGTELLPITLKAYNDTPGGWEGIYLDPRSSLDGAFVSLKHCIIEQGEDYNIYSHTTTETTMENCVIRNSANHGLIAFNSTLSHIHNSTITENAGFGIYIDGTSSLILGNNPLYTNNIYGNGGSFELYNNSSIDTEARYNYWGTNDSAMIATKIYDKFDNSAKGIVHYMDFAALPSLPSTNTIMEGTIVYANSILSPIKNAVIEIEDFDNFPIASTNTNDDGEYLFAGFPSGNYQMNIFPFDDWGGVNATDALIILNHFAQIDTLMGMPKAVADVNQSGTINATDAMMVMRRYAGLIDSFQVGDYLSHIENVVVNGDLVTQNIKMLCYGDVNASYEPQGFKNNGINLIYENSISVNSFTEFSLPLTIKSEMTIGAISLGLYYPEEYIEILDLEISDASTSVFWSAENGLLKIAWCNLYPLSLENDDVILSLNIKTKDIDEMTDGIYLNLHTNSEFADEYAVVLQGIEIAVPVIDSWTTLSETQNFGESSFSVFPNPLSLSNVANIDFTLTSNSIVSFEFYNMLGMKVKSIENQIFDIGNHVIEMQLGGLSAGMYMLKMNCDNNVSSYSKINRIVITE